MIMIDAEPSPHRRIESLDEARPVIFNEREPVYELVAAVSALPDFFEKGHEEDVFRVADVAVIDPRAEASLAIAVRMPRYVAADAIRSLDLLQPILQRDYDQLEPDLEVKLKAAESILKREIDTVLANPQEEKTKEGQVQLRFIRVLKRVQDHWDAAPPKRRLNIGDPFRHLVIDTTGDVFFGGKRLGNLHHAVGIVEE